jgi:hypothetical protein
MKKPDEKTEKRQRTDIPEQFNAVPMYEETPNVFEFECELCKERMGKWEMYSHTCREWKDYGISSITILSVLAGIKFSKNDIPYDPADFKRCHDLLMCLPPAVDKKALLKKVAEKYPDWRPLVDNWDKLTSLYLEESKNETQFENAPKLYKLMQKLHELMKK